jgi:hypothetical protein
LGKQRQSGGELTSNNVLNKSWPSKTIQTFSEFVSAIDALGPHWPNKHQWMFRGQMIQEWSLEPSIVRIFKSQGLSIEKLVSIESDIRVAFYREAHRFVDQQCFSVAQENICQWWAVMRHYGAPTRILDWSLSPYVALYFAVEGAWDTNGTLWCVKGKSVGQRFKAADSRAYKTAWRDRNEKKNNPFIGPSSSNFLYVYDMQVQIDRIAAQQGRFTVSTNGLADHAELLTISLPQQDLLRIDIPADAKPQMLRELHLMNIAAKALFPGIDGLGKSLHERARLSIKFDRPAAPTNGSVEAS